MRLFSYNMTHDSGFAPNPFHGTLTLATCKPGIRRTKQVGDWIAGFSSIALSRNAKKFGVTIDIDALLYLGQVSEIKPLGEYFIDPMFRLKIPPQQLTDDQIQNVGDNIYKQIGLSPVRKPKFEQVSTLQHGTGDLEHDTNGVNALIFRNFYYLGAKGIPIPKDIQIQISRPSGPSPYGYKTEKSESILRLIDWLDSTFGEGRTGYPCMWSKEPGSSCGGCSS
ncbi:conserved hypothetical protein [Magnetococcus marinus MC-1]|uniref:Nucleotide modification associated domain-containing protein n=1 Tax=Magnetococcus marinus (strain ATCC BAA-1437 / JCM 17883 / MC-1) TaxID=156889 RepID=A0LC52_MAGMM|nr:hypothetical protein [Magnetococcus marinus]ABK45545.1 conserved hypothetical protein [Magnetococcus marinus MC-1]